MEGLVRTVTDWQQGKYDGPFVEGIVIEDGEAFLLHPSRAGAVLTGSMGFYGTLDGLGFMVEGRMDGPWMFFDQGRLIRGGLLPRG